MKFNTYDEYLTYKSQLEHKAEQIESNFEREKAVLEQSLAPLVGKANQVVSIAQSLSEIDTQALVDNVRSTFVKGARDAFINSGFLEKILRGIKNRTELSIKDQKILAEAQLEKVKLQEQKEIMYEISSN